MTKSEIEIKLIKLRAGLKAARARINVPRGAPPEKHLKRQIKLYEQMLSEEKQKEIAGLDGATICSADGDGENEERKRLENIAAAVLMAFDNDGTPQKIERERKILIAALREARKVEREKCARICEDLVTFSEEHINYAPEDSAIPCGWCNGLEKAASLIRASE